MPRIKRQMVAENPQKKVVFTPKGGMNQRDLSFLVPTTRVVNLLPEGEGIWKKRMGKKTVLDLSGSATLISLFRKWKEKFVVMYDDKGSLWDGTSATVADFTGMPAGSGANFTTDDPFSGDKYGARFFLSNKGDKLGFVNTSGEWTTISHAPKCAVVKVFQNRILCGNTNTHESELHVSKGDDGAGDFSAEEDWAISDGILGNPFKKIFANAGALRSIGVQGELIVPIHDEGKYGFHIEVLDVGTSGLNQNAKIDFENLDFGGAKGAISCKYGIFYANEYGVFRMMARTAQDLNESAPTNILGKKYLESLDFSDCSIAYMPIEEMLLISCRKNSAKNNHVLVLDFRSGGISEIVGWDIARFELVGNTLYGVSSKSAKIYELFSGFADDGQNIWCKFESGDETFGNPDIWKKSKYVSAQGRLAFGGIATIEIDIRDKQDAFVSQKIRKKWTQSGITNEEVEGVGEWGIGEGVFSGGSEDDLFSSYAQEKLKTGKFRSVRVRVSENSQMPFEFHFLAITAEIGRQIKKSGFQNF